MNDLFILNPTNLTWTNVTARTQGPTPSRRTGCLFAALSGRLYLFGGWDDISLHFFGDLFVLDPTALIWTDLSHRVNGDAPPPVSGHGLAVLDGRLYVFGGAINVGGTVGAHRADGKR